MPKVQETGIDVTKPKRATTGWPANENALGYLLLTLSSCISAYYQMWPIVIFVCLGAFAFAVDQICLTIKQHSQACDPGCPFKGRADA